MMAQPTGNPVPIMLLVTETLDNLGIPYLF